MKYILFNEDSLNIFVLLDFRDNLLMTLIVQFIIKNKNLFFIREFLS